MIASSQSNCSMHPVPIPLFDLQYKSNVFYSIGLMGFENRHSIKSLVIKSQPPRVGVCDHVLEISHGSRSHTQKELLLSTNSGPNHHDNFSNST